MDEEETYQIKTLQVDRGCGCGNMSGFYRGLHALGYQTGVIPRGVQLPFQIGKNRLEIPEVTVKTCKIGDETKETFYVPRSGGEPAPISVEQFIALVEERGGLVRIIEPPKTGQE